MTTIEKILARHSGESEVEPGDIVWAHIDRTMSIDLSIVAGDLEECHVKQLWDPDRVVVIHDHNIPPSTVVMADRYSVSREWVSKLGIENCYEMGSGGICHQVFVEKGFARPGELVASIDSHTCTYGALNCAATGIYDEHVFVLATGKLWFWVPETIRFELLGALGEMVMPKDIVLHIAGAYGADVGLGKAIEFVGPAAEDMSISGRLSMANMGVELGAQFALFEADQKTFDYLSSRTDGSYDPVQSDPGARFAATHTVSVSDLEPQVASPDSVDNVKGISEVTGIRIDQAFLGSCANGRIEDIEIAARILEGRQVHSGVRMIVTPASQQVYADALRLGLLDVLVSAGAVITNSTCGACPGSCLGLLGAGETCIATTNRNFKGRMGSPSSSIFLASPATVAASAVSGFISDPREYSWL